MLTWVWQTLIDVALTSESTIAVQTFTLKPVHRAGSNVELDITDAMLELETTIHHNIHAQFCTHSLLQCRVRYFRPGIFIFYFWVKKIKTCWIYKNTVFAKWGKYRVSWNFSFFGGCLKIVYQDHLTQLLPLAWDFVGKGQWLVRGQVG